MEGKKKTYAEIEPSEKKFMTRREEVSPLVSRKQSRVLSIQKYRANPFNLKEVTGPEEEWKSLTAATQLWQKTGCPFLNFSLCYPRLPSLQSGLSSSASLSNSFSINRLWMDSEWKAGGLHSPQIKIMAGPRQPNFDLIYTELTLKNIYRKCIGHLEISTLPSFRLLPWLLMRWQEVGCKW